MTDGFPALHLQNYMISKVSKLYTIYCLARAPSVGTWGGRSPSRSEANRCINLVNIYTPVTLLFHYSPRFSFPKVSIFERPRFNNISGGEHPRSPIIDARIALSWPPRFNFSSHNLVPMLYRYMVYFTDTHTTQYIIPIMYPHTPSDQLNLNPKPA